jgi:hypothetical protein
MITVRRTVVVPAPLDRVAPYLSDFSTTERWDPHTARCTRLQDEAVHVGSTYRNVQKVGPFRPGFTYRVVRHEVEKLIALRAESRSVVSTDTLEFAEQTDERGGLQTVVTYTAVLEPKGVARVLEPLLARMMERFADDGAAGMRDTLVRDLVH